MRFCQLIYNLFMTIFLLFLDICSFKEALFASFDTLIDFANKLIIFFTIYCLGDALLGRDFCVWVLPTVLIEYYHLVFVLCLAKWEHLFAASFLHISLYRF